MLEKEMIVSMIEDYTQLMETEEVYLARHLENVREKQSGPSAMMAHQINENTLRIRIADFKAKKKALEALLQA